MRKKICITIVILVLALPAGLAAVFHFLLNNRPGSPAPLPAKAETEFRVGILNINWLNFNHDPEYTTARLASSILENDIDIVLLQEYKCRWQFADEDFISHFPQMHLSIQGECACISRFPVISHDRVKYDDLSDSFSDLEIQLPCGRLLRMFGAHLVTTGVNNFKRSDRFAGTGLVWTLLNNGEIRKNQALSLSRRCGSVRGPLVVAGDFNCIPGASPYRKMRSVPLKDSFLSLGKGKGATYRNLKDQFRIDYIFYNKDLECTDSRIIDDGISDHRMVVSTFRFPDKTEEREWEK